MIEFAHFNLIYLAVLPIIVFLLPFVYISQRTALRVPFIAQLMQASGEEEAQKQAYSKATPFQKLSALLIWLLIVAALMKPEYIGEPITKTVSQREMVIAVDLSESMDTKDVESIDGNKTTRLDAIKEVLNSFLAQREGEKIALIVFGTMAFVQAPFTSDLKTLQELLDEMQVSMAGPRTAIGDSIGLSVKLFQKSNIKERLMILLTDGTDTASKVPPKKAAGVALDNNIKIITIAFGSAKNAGENPIDTKTLQYIAQHTKGEFYDANDTASLQGITDEINALKPKKVKKLSYRPSKELFVYPVALAFLMLLLNAIVLLFKKRTIRRRADD